MCVTARPPPPRGGWHKPWEGEDVVAHRLWRSPVIEVSQGLVDLGNGQAAVVEERFEAGAAEVLLDGLDDALFVLDKKLAELANLLLALGQRARDA